MVAKNVDNKIKFSKKVAQDMQSSSIKTADKNGFLVYYKFGLDIFERVLSGDINLNIIKKFESTKKNKGARSVWFFEENGKKYILKWIKKPVTPRKKVLYFLFGSYYPRLLKRVTNAINNGCKATNDIYFVAEKKNSALETYILMEFVEGKSLDKFSQDEVFSYNDKIVEKIKELHFHNLSSNDIAPYNILANDDNLKIIDLSDDTPFFISKVKDKMEACRYYGFEYSLFGSKKGFVYFYLSCREAVRKVLKKL